MAENEIAGNCSKVPYFELAESSYSLASVSAIQEQQQDHKKKKVPRRIIHCSDGILEEYSTDDEQDEPDGTQPLPVDPKTLPWLPWCWHYVSTAGSKSLAAADYCGEKLAWMLGITSPKYQYILDEHNRRLAEEEEERSRDEREREAERRRQTQQFVDAESAVESCYAATATVAMATELPTVTVTTDSSTIGAATSCNL